MIEHIRQSQKYTKICDSFRFQLSSRPAYWAARAPVGLQGLGTLGLGTPVQAGCWWQKH